MKRHVIISMTLTQLRKEMFLMLQMEFVVLETSGELVSLKPRKRPLSAEDLKIRNDYEGMPLTLIDDGEVNFKGLEDANLSLEWLEGELKKRNIKSVMDVFYASLSSNGEIYLVEREETEENAQKEKKLH